MGTRATFILNVFLYVLGLFLPQDWSLSSNSAAGNFCMFPKAIWFAPQQVYRMFTSAFLHANLMHIGFNMFSLVQAGPSLERMLGTSRYLCLITCFVASLGVLYYGISLFCLFVFGFDRFFNECAIGFSGVLFSLMTIESLLASADRSLSLPFGVQVPSRLYPWALLVFCQFIMPGVSLIGHMVGILGAYLYMLGALWILLPSEPFVEHLEGMAVLQRLVTCASFVPCSQSQLRLLPSHLQPGGTHYRSTSPPHSCTCNASALHSHG
jgi:membrane associated rhomboid family serine protease